jgi:hypothetical protein
VFVSDVRKIQCTFALRLSFAVIAIVLPRLLFARTDIVVRRQRSGALEVQQISTNRGLVVKAIIVFDSGWMPFESIYLYLYFIVFLKFFI